MKARRFVFTAAAVSVACATVALALPPRNVDVQANKGEAVQACLSTCAAHAHAPAACSYQCRRIFLPIYGPVQGLDTSPANVASCLAGEAGVWAWYAACQADLSVFSDGVTASLAQLVNSTQIAKAMMGAASGLADPCGYVKDQLLAESANRCPASVLLPGR